MIIKCHKQKLTCSSDFKTTDVCKDPTTKLVAKALLTHVIKNPYSPIITYKELSQLCDNKIHPRNLNTPLGNLSDLCLLNGLPPISSVVYNQADNRPGAGFFKYFYPQLPEKEWDKKFIECINEVMDCNRWEEFLTIFE